MSEWDPALAVGSDQGAEEFVAFLAGDLKVISLEGFPDPLACPIGLADAEVGPPSPVVVPEVMGGFATRNSDSEFAENSRFFGRVAAHEERAITEPVEDFKPSRMICVITTREIKI